MKRLLLMIVLVVMILSGCYINATITDPSNKIYTYYGPKDVDMSIKEGNTEVVYSGKNPPWWQGMLPFLFKAIPDVAVVK